jgi:ABC-type nitrate/sulfonate/bicarbonate transport system permease component
VASFFIFAVVFLTLLTLVVRLGRLRVRFGQGGLGLGRFTLAVHFEPMRVRAGLPETKALGLTATFVGLVLLGWWFATSGATVENRLLSPIILPSPLEVLQAFPKLHFEQGLVRSALTSFVRVSIGFALAALVAVPLGVYMATFPPVSAFFRPLALVGSYVPIVVFVPLTLAWWGLSETQKVGFLFIGCFVALLPMIIKDVSDVPAAYLDVAVTKGASQWQLVQHVLFPVVTATSRTSGTISAASMASAGAGSSWRRSSTPSADWVT